MTERRHILLAVVSTALAVATVASEATHGGLWSWLLMLIVIAAPIGAAMQVFSLRKQGHHEAAAEAMRWVSGVAVTVAVVVALGDAVLDGVRADCDALAGRPRP